MLTEGNNIFTDWYCFFGSDYFSLLKIKANSKFLIFFGLFVWPGNKLFTWPYRKSKQKYRNFADELNLVVYYINVVNTYFSKAVSANCDNSCVC